MYLLDLNGRNVVLSQLNLFCSDGSYNVLFSQAILRRYFAKHLHELSTAIAVRTSIVAFICAKKTS
jgi:hypothetical protein